MLPPYVKLPCLQMAQNIEFLFRFSNWHHTVHSSLASVDKICIKSLLVFNILYLLLGSATAELIRIKRVFVCVYFRQ